MSNFLNNVAATGSFELASSIKPIPHNTQVQAMVKEAKWHEHEGIRKVEITWVILAPDAYKNRQIFQKIRPFEPDEKKRENQLKMLAAINTNAGGILHTLSGEPSDFDLQSNLQHKQMLLKLGVWKMGDGEGNWVMAVAPNGAVAEVDTPAPLDDEIPF